MLKTLTLLTEPLASLKKMPNSPGNGELQLAAGSGNGKPVVGPVMVRFSILINVAPAALVTTAPV